MTAATTEQWSHAFDVGRAPLFSTIPPASGALAYRNLRQGEFWRAIPAYSNVDEATFLDHIWQGRQSIKTPAELLETIKDLVPASFFEDAREGFRRAPMAVRRI
jgi:lysine 2,3-aminomutase